MRICKLELSKFRGIEHCSLVFPQHSVLLGSNNAGKSAIAEALALLFSRERMYQPISDWDFFGGDPRPESRFTITATLSDFGNPANDEPESHAAWFAGDGATPVWWSDATESVVLTMDRPENTRLAAQISLTGRYDDEACEFELKRYFHDGPCDPFDDDCRVVPNELLREVGVFLLPSAREWDKLLSFGASTFIKVLKEYEAVPGQSIEQLKHDLRSEVTKVEEAEPFATILKDAESELQTFFLQENPFRLVYRPTGLDATSVMRSLVAFLSQTTQTDDILLPVARQGSGVISLQTLLLLLAFGRKRLEKNKNFVLIAEEPELHLHPALHRKLANRIRAAAMQSIVTTHSPHIASGYRPTEVLFLRNLGGQLFSKPVRKQAISNIGKDRIENLYLRFRPELYEALMGPRILIPEGISDYYWLRLWQRVVESSDRAIEQFRLTPLCFIPTVDAAVAETYLELSQFRPDAVPFVDGDTSGQSKVQRMLSESLPSKIIQLGESAGVEYLSAWILEPALKNPSAELATLLPEPSERTLKCLQRVLSARKKDFELHENLAWECTNTHQCVTRAAEFLYDTGLITAGDKPKNAGWVIETFPSGTSVFRATHIKKV
jgi:putative ATP-dependent endonuclease of the OLD family